MVRGSRNAMLWCSVRQFNDMTIGFRSSCSAADSVLVVEIEGSRLLAVLVLKV